MFKDEEREMTDNNRVIFLLIIDAEYMWQCSTSPINYVYLRFQRGLRQY